MIILNLTQHEATLDQQNSGVRNLKSENYEEIKKLLTFENIPTSDEMIKRAHNICNIILKEKGRKIIDGVMIGGAPFFMSTLEKIIRRFFKNLKILYAFSKREVEVIIDPFDKSVNKSSVFKHIGFVEI